MKHTAPDRLRNEPEIISAGIAGLIWLRERFLNLITGNTHLPILNASEGELAHHNYPNLSADIKVKLEEILAAAIDESGTRVDYGRIIRDPAYLSFKKNLTPRLKSFDPATLGTREEKLAFWINLYNALVLDGVITFAVEKSILDVGMAGLAFFRKAAYQVGGQRMSCDDIEHGILRGNRGHPFIPGPQFVEKDPRLAWVIEPPDLRIHFALNCASRSCPPIRFYDASLLEDQLNRATKNFLASSVMIDTSQQALSLSQIFKWYQRDFGGKEGVIEFLITYYPDESACEWISGNRKIIRLSYMAYDWRLNFQANHGRQEKVVE